MTPVSSPRDRVLMRCATLPLLLVIGLSFVFGVGCRESAAPAPKSPPDAEAPAKETTAVVWSDLPFQEREEWEILFMNNRRVGHQVTRFAPDEEEDGRKVLRMSVESVLKIDRASQVIESRSESNATLLPNGELLEFVDQTGQGDQIIQRVRGRVEDGVLTATVEAAGQLHDVKTPWKPENRGPNGVLLSFLADPMEVGETRSITTFDLLGLSEHHITARKMEAVDINGVDRELLRIEDRISVSQQSMRAVYWADEQGDVLKTSVDSFLEAVRATQEEALDEAAPAGDVDLVFDVTVPLGRKLPEAHDTKHVRYVTTLTDSDPAELFSVGPTQRIESIDDRTAILDVRAVRPNALPGDLGERTTAPDEAVASNPLISSDAPSVAALASRITKGRTDWETAVAVERFVHDNMKRGDFSRMLSPASEVAATLSGDCTEYAVLTAALLRRFEIPSRVAVGLVYFETASGNGVFGYHMWTEAFIDGYWIPLDATLGRGGIGAAHLKIGDSYLADPIAVTALLPVFRAIGKLKLEVLDGEPPSPNPSIQDR